jgi:WD40 repeat protein
MAKVLADTGEAEIDLRDWFEHKLITEAGTRGSVYRGTGKTEGISTRTADLLVNQFLLRTENRAGGIWYELVHDRFIEPILQSNQSWREQQPLLQLARTWEMSGKSEGQLLSGPALQNALVSNWRGLGPLVGTFLAASQTAQQAREEAQRQRELEQARALAEAEHQRAEAQTKAARRLRWIIAALAVTLVVLLGLVGVTLYAVIQRQEVIISHEAITTLLSLDGRLYISVAPDDRTVTLVDTADQEVLLTLTGNTAEISKITLSPNADYLATADHGGMAVIWNLNTGQAIAKLAGHSGTIRYVVFSHDGRWVATGGDDGTTRLWDTSTWQQTHVLNSDGASIISVAFWPDDSFLVTATTDKKYSIWNPQTGEKVLDGSQ